MATNSVPRSPASPKQRRNRHAVGHGVRGVQTSRAHMKRRKKQKGRSRGAASRHVKKALSPQLSERARRAHAHLAISDWRWKIHYLIPHEPQDLANASLFGWYTAGLHAAAGPLITAATLPADIRD